MPSAWRLMASMSADDSRSTDATCWQPSSMNCASSALPAGIAVASRQLRRGTLEVSERHTLQPLPKSAHSHTERCQGITEIVQYPLRHLREARFERLIDQLLPRFLQSRDHAVEFATELPELVVSGTVQPGRQVRALADRDGVAGHACERCQHDAIQQYDDQKQDDDGGHDDRQGCVADRRQSHWPRFAAGPEPAGS